MLDNETVVDPRHRGRLSPAQCWDALGIERPNGIYPHVLMDGRVRWWATVAWRGTEESAMHTTLRAAIDWIEVTTPTAHRREPDAVAAARIAAIAIPLARLGMTERERRFAFDLPLGECPVWRVIGPVAAELGGLTMEEIGMIWGVTMGRIEQISSGACARVAREFPLLDTLGVEGRQ